MNLFGHKRKRIFILFFMGIVLPSLLLGYLAFRGVKNDQALVEKNRLDDQRRNAESVIRTVGAFVSAMEQDFLKALTDRPRTSPDALFPSLEKLKPETMASSGPLTRVIRSDAGSRRKRWAAVFCRAEK